MQPPGPSALAFVRGIQKKGLLDYVGELWRQYGDLFQVRLGRRRLVFAMHPDMVEHINLTRRASYDKIASYDPVRTYLTGDGIVCATGELWRRQRKLMAPLYTPAGIRAYAGMMIAHGLDARDRWHDRAREGKEVEISEEMSALTASIILQAMFTSSTMEGMDHMRSAVETMIDFVQRRSTGFCLPSWLPTRAQRRYAAAREAVHRSIASLIDARRKMPEAEHPADLLSRLMAMRDETGEPMHDSLLRDESLTTFFAGHETTARTLTFAWYALAQNPRVEARLHQELDRTLQGEAPTPEALRYLPYTSQVIQEVLRLYPPVPYYARDAARDDELAGFDIPQGTAVMLSPYYSHRHPEFWANPDAFEPERWESGPASHPHAFHPFATGPRICIGNHFSLLESQLLLAILAQRFTPRLRPGYAARWEARGVLGLAGGLPMVITERSSHEHG